MKRSLQIASLIAILGFGGVANAEQSGGFLGLEVGYGMINVPLNYSYQGFNGNVLNPDFGLVTSELLVDLNGGGVDFGFVGGYKQFFNRYFGLRYYANVNVIMAKVKPKVTKDDSGTGLYNGTESRSAMIINYSANIDMLINFIVRERNRIADFGMFLGIGLGGNNYSGKAINEIDDYMHNVMGRFIDEAKGWKAKRNFFDFSLNVGLRTNIAVNHGLELALRMPLVKNTLIDETGYFNYGAVEVPYTLKINTKTPSYNITLRYVYSFGTAKKVIRKVIKKRRVKKPTQQTDPSSIEQRSMPKQEQNSI